MIFAELEAEAPRLMRGEIKVDESYFGGYQKGELSRSAASKVAVFGMLKQRGKVHVVIISDATQTLLSLSFAKKIRPNSIVYIDAFGGYDVLDVSKF